MKTVIIYLHGEVSTEGQPIEINDTDTIGDIIKRVKKKDGNESSNGEYHLFLEDKEESTSPKLHPKDAGIRDKVRVHCHRCQKVKVTIVYNNVQKHMNVSPSFTGDTVLGLIPDLFGISESDVADLRLKIDETHFLQSTDHIGSFVSFPHCKIELSLVPKINVQG